GAPGPAPAGRRGRPRRPARLHNRGQGPRGRHPVPQRDPPGEPRGPDAQPPLHRPGGEGGRRDGGARRPHRPPGGGLVTAEMEMSRMATELSRVLTESKLTRVPIDDLLARAHAVDPGLLGDPAGRSRFREALDELAAAGRLTLPAAGSRAAWDRRSRPPMPLWVKRTAPARPRRERPEPRVWPHVLEKAGRLATRRDEQQLLERVAAWLRDNPEPAPVPVQERSAELFGDEKALDRHLKTRLFTTGALTLDLL